MRELLIDLIRKIDNNIHPKRIREVLRYFNYILITFGLILFSISIGVVGFIVIEGFSFVDALYMTIITVSTVGFGEVRQLSTEGRMFVSLLIIFNVGIFAYSVGNLANFIVQGDLRRIFKDLLIGRKIDKMNDHIIVCGYGRYGRSVIQHLLNQNLQCVLIETDLEKVEEIRKEQYITVLEGDATDEETLREAGVDHARALVTTLPEDADNVYVTLSTRHLNTEIKIISRANIASSKKNLLKAGANQVLIPENIGGFYMSSLITKPDIIQIFTEISSLEGSTFRLAEIILDPLPSRLLGRTLSDLSLEEKAGVKIIGMKYHNGEMTVNPIPNTELKEKMGIVVLGNQEQISKFHSFVREFDLIE